MKKCIVFSAIVLSSIASSQIIADSVSDFSSTQGHLGWFYGFYNKTADPTPAVYSHATEFQLMSTFKATHSLSTFLGPAWTVNDNANGVWTRLSAEGGCGNGVITSGGRQSVEHFAVRRWVSTYTGLVTISGALAKLDVGGNGVSFILYKNSSPILAASNAPITTLAGTQYSLTTSISSGDRLDMFLDPWMANDLSDSSKLTMQIKAVPEPTTIAILLPILLLLKRKRSCS